MPWYTIINQIDQQKPKKFQTLETPNYNEGAKKERKLPERVKVE